VTKSLYAEGRKPKGSDHHLGGSSQAGIQT
jgi:hypothetical protein